MKKAKWVVVGIGGLALVAGVMLAGYKGQTTTVGSAVAAAPQQGYRMPPFTLTEYPDNKTLSTQDLIGKPIFINFWTSWCTYCQLESPDLVKAYKKYGNKVVFLSVNVTAQDKMQDVIQFFKNYGMTWPVQLDETGQVAQEYKIVGFPTSFFVNRQGLITDVNVGAISPDNLDAQLRGITN